MPDSFHPQARSGNRMLAALGADVAAAMAPHLQRIECKVKQVLGERGQPIDHVFFPCGAVLSVLAYMQNGAAVEVGTVGNEGFCGLEAVAGGTHWTETTVCQVGGEAMRMAVGDFREAIASDTPLRRITQRYLLAYLSIISQSVACNRLHHIEERFARWVLMTHDRVAGDEFYLTQEFLADMLGVHRPSVSVVAGAFQQAGFIKYSRGRMTILDREGLENASCECYEVGSAQVSDMLCART